MSKANEMKSSNTKSLLYPPNLNGRFYRAYVHPPIFFIFLCRNAGGVPHLKVPKSLYQALCFLIP